MYEVITLNTLNEPSKVMHRSRNYGTALAYLLKHIDGSPNLDLTLTDDEGNRSFVAWEFPPKLVSV